MRLLALVLIFLTSFVQAQSILTVSGRIVDNESNEPLTFASVSIKNQSVSTVSNLQGEFDFHFPSTYRSGRLVVSMLGYENYEGEINSLLFQDTLVIRLNKAVKVLEEVVIHDSLTGGDIVRIALSRIEQNYPMQPYLMDGFYRDLKKLGGTYFSLLEAAVKIYDEDYKEPKNKYRLRERVALMEVRKSLGYNNKFTRFFEQDNLLEQLLLHNNIKYKQFPEDDIFFDLFKRMSGSVYNGHKVFIVLSKTDQYNLKMFIDTDNYAIIKMEYERFYEDEVLRKRRGLVSKYISDKKIIDYKQYMGIMYLNYMRVESQINWYNEETGDLRFETELHQELLINKVYPDPDQRIGSTEKMRRYGLQYQDQKYNKEFWTNYNVIKDTPLDKEIVSDLEKLGDLEEQFENY